ncbi:2'-5' RNA ligase family protein [Kitasatospora sp. NPDC052896]|uniref:2'-5' RNA ligase family protein n=1 Tax=Kitasatospora sp. NPDC052896 TaxID=3364061 RepID=UPI0037CA3CE9
MQGLGFVGEVGEEDVRATADGAAERLAQVPAFDVSLGPAIVTPEALLLTVAPEDGVRAVRSAIREAVGEVWGEVPEAADGFRPHVSVAYSNADGPAGPVAAALGTVTSSVTARIASAELIVLNRDNRMYEWETSRSVPLGKDDR